MQKLWHFVPEYDPPHLAFAEKTIREEAVVPPNASKLNVQQAHSTTKDVVAKLIPFPHNVLGSGEDAQCQWTSRNLSETELPMYDFTQQNAIREGICISPKLKDKLHIFSTKESLDCLTTGSDKQVQLVIAGDSYMKQLYIGLVDILIGKHVRQNQEIGNAQERDQFLSIAQSLSSKRHRNDSIRRFPSVQYECKSECYGTGDPYNWADACSNCIDKMVKSSNNDTRTIAIVGAGVHVMNQFKKLEIKGVDIDVVNATIQEMDSFMHKSINVKGNDVIFVSGPSYQTFKVPTEFRRSNNRMIPVYWNSLSHFENYPYLDVFQLTKTCHMQNCSTDGGHRSRFVNRWKAQLLLNMLCRV